MRFSHAIRLAAVIAIVGTNLGCSAAAKKRITLELIPAEGRQFRVTQIEGQTAEIRQDGPTGYHLGLVPTLSKQLVAIQILQLADGSRKRIAKVTGPVGEEMAVRVGGQATDPPTLRIIPQMVH